MPNKKHNEFLDHLFTNILKQPMMSNYCEQDDRHDRCHLTHIGKCRRICCDCEYVKFAAILPYSDRVDIYRLDSTYLRGNTPGLAYKFRDQKVKEAPPNTQHSWCELIINPVCDSCKYAMIWKRANWRKYVERAINGGRNERKELRRIFYGKEIRLTIRKLLTFFDCTTLTLTSVRDGLVGIIDYSYDW